jgi:hypothetical protein
MNLHSKKTSNIEVQENNVTHAKNHSLSIPPLHQHDYSTHEPYDRRKKSSKASIRAMSRELSGGQNSADLG